MSKFFRKMSLNRAFTLIEILVVIAIVSLLASMIVVSMAGARDRAKNARITTDLMSYAKALALYQSDHDGKFPGSDITTFCLGDGYVDGYCGYQQSGGGGSGMISRALAAPSGDGGLGGDPPITHAPPWAQDGALTSALASYFPGSALFPIGGNMRVSGFRAGSEGYFLGALYACYDDTCKKVLLTTALQGSNVACPRPANASEVTSSAAGSATKCLITIE